MVFYGSVRQRTSSHSLSKGAKVPYHNAMRNGRDGCLILVRDGLIEKMFIEPNKPGAPFEVSDADTMLSYIAPNARLPPQIALLTKPGCPFCRQAKDLLQQHGLAYSEVELDDPVRLRVVSAITGATTTPQMFFDAKLIGGSDAIVQWLGTRNNA